MKSVGVLPKKHTDPKNTLIGTGAIILRALNRPKLFDELWSELNVLWENPETAFDTLLLSLNFLFTMDLIKLGIDGRISKCT